MAYIEILAGTLVDSYTLATYNGANGGTPRCGDWTYNYNTAAGPVGKYIFLRNSGSASITANLVGVALAADRVMLPNSLTVPTPSIALGAATANLPFAGARVSTATAVAQNEFGWFQITGFADLTPDATGTTAESYVVTSATTAGKVVVMVSTAAADALGAFGIANATATTGTTKVAIFKNIWGL